MEAAQIILTDLYTTVIIPAGLQQSFTGALGSFRTLSSFSVGQLQSIKPGRLPKVPKKVQIRPSRKVVTVRSQQP